VGSLRAVGERWTVSLLVRHFDDAPTFSSPVTRASQSWLVAAVSADPLGRVKVGRLDVPRLTGAVACWRKAGLSEHQVRGRVAVVRAAVSWACAEDYLLRDMLAGVRGLAVGGLPRTHTPVHVVREAIALARLDLGRARVECTSDTKGSAALWRAFRAEQTLLAVCLLAEVGLRRGERTGLRSDDLDGAALSVERAVKRAQAGVVVGPTKTYRSGRVTVSPMTARLWCDYLSRWFGPTALSGVESFWLFARRPGASTPFSPETLAGRFGQLAQRTGAAGPVSLHRVRHTAATLLVTAGELAGAQHRLRHSRLDTTLRHYVDTTGLTDDRDVANELQRLYDAGACPISAKPFL
jgi:integrase